MNLLECKDLHFAYAPKAPVLTGLDLRVAQGQVVGLLGSNGAGKTTLMHIALGMLRPQRGATRVFGIDPLVDPVQVKQRVGFLSEQQLLPPGMRVRAVLDFHRQLFPTWDKALEHDLLERFPLDLRTRVAHLSKGQARQLGLLCAVAHRPELLLLDEPAGGLDPAARRQFLEASIQLLNESGSTIVFSSHHMTDVERMADRIVLLDGGGLLLDGALDELHEQYVVAVLPGSGANAQKLADLHSCLRVRRHKNTVHAVLRGTSEAVGVSLARELPEAHAACQHVPLEELFVELLGVDS